MKIKTSELAGPALDWAVAHCEQMDYFHPEAGPKEPSYSTDWTLGGPIIDREGILLRPIRSPGHSMDGQCLAKYGGTNTGTIVQWVKRKDWPGSYQAGPTTLIAAMRCFVASKLGDEVDIPEELL